MAHRGILKEYASSFGIAQRITDLVIVSITAWLAHWLYLDIPIPSKAYLVVLLIAVLLTAWIFPQLRLYQIWRGGSILDEVKAVTAAWGLVLILMVVFAFLFKVSAIYSRGWFLIWSVIGWFSFIASRVMLRSLLREIRKRGLNVRNIIVVGSERFAAEVIGKMESSPWMGLRIAAFFNITEPTDDGTVLNTPVLGGIEDVPGYLDNNDIDQVWIASPLRYEEKIEKLLFELRNHTVDIRFVPDFLGLQLLNHSIMDVGGMPVINLSISPMSGQNLIIKALEDRILSLLILVLISPLLIVISILVKTTSPGPAIYKQKRHGWDGKVINVYKFRTMRVHNEENGTVTQAKRGDARITRVGRFLRATSLDELPQFLNVLQGRMSIVGPRPHAVEHNEQYRDKIDKYMLRHKVKPGITGWAQINGWRGETDTLNKMKKRIEYDLYYIENWSIWFDLKIIFLTLIKGFFHKNAY